MSDTSIKEWLRRVRQAVLTVIVVAVAVRLAWVLLAPVLPELVSFAVILTVLGVAVYGRRSK